MATNSSTSALLLEAPVGRHFAQLHRDSETLTRAVSTFAEIGLRRGNGIILVATPSHIDAVLERLRLANLDPAAYRDSGQLAIHDAAAMLERLMRGGMPQWLQFRRVVGEALESAQLFGRAPTRAYGEMVNLLWQAGEAEAAIRLEEYWNALAKTYPFCLFCGYLLDSQRPECYHAPLHEIGRLHTDVLATRDDDRFRSALDAACNDVFGIPLSQMLSLSGQEEYAGESRLPGGQRTMLWITRHMPSSSADVLERARRYYKEMEN